MSPEEKEFISWVAFFGGMVAMSLTAILSILKTDEHSEVISGRLFAVWCLLVAIFLRL